MAITNGDGDTGPGPRCGEGEGHTRRGAVAEMTAGGLNREAEGGLVYAAATINDADVICSSCSRRVQNLRFPAVVIASHFETR